MTQAAQIAYLKGVTGETDESILRSYLDISAEAILRRVYPFREDETVVPERYTGRQAEIAGYLLNKRGAEGETYHSENGINRSYAEAYIPASFFKGVTPYLGVI